MQRKVGPSFAKQICAQIVAVSAVPTMLGLSRYLPGDATRGAISADHQVRDYRFKNMILSYLNDLWCLETMGYYCVCNGWDRYGSLGTVEVCGAKGGHLTPNRNPRPPYFFAFFCFILLYFDALEFVSLWIGCASSLILLNRTYMCFPSYFNRMCRKKWPTTTFSHYITTWCACVGTVCALKSLLSSVNTNLWQLTAPLLCFIYLCTYTLGIWLPSSWKHDYQVK